MPTSVEAGLWGLLGGAALVIGAVIAWSAPVPPRVVASVMAFGSGVLISAVAFDLMEEAEHTGGLAATAFGFLGGAVAYLAADLALARRGARHRKRSESQRPSEAEQAGSGAAIAIGALLDGVPESVVLGLGLIGGGSVSLSVLAAVFISNVPEGLSSASSGRVATVLRNICEVTQGKPVRCSALRRSPLVLFGSPSRPSGSGRSPLGRLPWAGEPSDAAPSRACQATAR